MNDFSANQALGLTNSLPESPKIESAKRRRVLLGGGVGAVLATVKSGSALAGGVCVSPSSFHSISATPKSSLPPRTYGSCSSHGFYGNSGIDATTMDQRWSPVLRNTATLAGASFPSQGVWSSTAVKLKDIVAAPPTIGWQEDGNLIVIYLDIMTSRANGALTVSDLMDMWRIRYSLGGVVNTTRFSGWTPADVKNFYDVWVGNSSL